MSQALETAKRYFDLSNNRDIAGIEALFSERSSSGSATSGMYLSRKDISIMHKRFRSVFSSIQWRVDRIRETKPGVVQCEFTFTGKRISGEDIVTRGIEYIIVHQGRIQHIETTRA